MSNKAKHFLGMDIGTSAIKIARISFPDSRIHLDVAAITATPPESVRYGRILDMKALAAAISHLLEMAQIYEKNIVMAVGRTEAMIHSFSSFSAPDAELEEIIFARAEQYFPYDFDTVNFDYQVLNSAESSEDEITVAGACVKKERVQERIALADMAGLSLDILDAEAFALQNIHEILYGLDTISDEKGILLLVDMGEQGSTLLFLAGEKPVTVRENTIGTGQIISRMQHSAMDTEKKEAIQILSRKKNLGNHSQNHLLFLDICQDIVNIWCLEIQNQVRLFQDEHSQTKVKKIYISGGGSLIGSFSKTLAARLDIPVEVMDPFTKISTEHTRFFPSEKEISGPQMAIALGLAVRRPGHR